ncbi:hypothetical protein B0J14DRAFT_677604 [Halenospora varia]|nr:hypothetical protein B0J14DRAFT_677604 [Halenospora varia]
MANIPPLAHKVFHANYIMKAPNTWPIINNPWDATTGEWEMQRDFPFFMAQHYLPHNGQQPLADQFGFCHVSHIVLGNARKSKHIKKAHKETAIKIIRFGRAMQFPSIQNFIRMDSQTGAWTAAQVIAWYNVIMKLPHGSNIASLNTTPWFRIAGLYQNTAYFHHEGSIRCWVNIPPWEKNNVDNLIRMLCPDVPAASQKCLRWVNHLSLWLKTSLLKQHNITSYYVQQNPNELLFIFRGLYYLSYTAGVTVMESKYYGGHDWLGWFWRK